ncbi:MAG: hypothetical protein RR954_09615, partial [Christensenellaceae bacterium]
RKPFSPRFHLHWHNPKNSTIAFACQIKYNKTINSKGKYHYEKNNPIHIRICLPASISCTGKLVACFALCPLHWSSTY